MWYECKSRPVGAGETSEEQGVAIYSKEILQSLVDCCRHTGKERKTGKDRGRERQIGLYLNLTMGFSGLSPAAALISLLVQRHILYLAILSYSDDSLSQVSQSVCSVNIKYFFKYLIYCLSFGK